MRWDVVPVEELSAAVSEPDRAHAERMVRRYERELEYACTSALGSQRADTKLVAYMIALLLDSPLPGSILVFLPGYEDISEVRRMLLNGGALAHCATRPCVFVLHSEMDAHNQRNVFGQVAAGQRKVILSTNIAEASLTIDDVVFVIDSGYMKEKRFAHDAHISLLTTVPESKTNAIQRSGRSGRCRPGWCFRLFTQSQYENMAVAQQPEMQRASIHELCLEARYLSPANESVAQFLNQCPQPPPDSVVVDAIEHLKAVGCMKADESLTAQGRLTAELPLAPGQARTVLMACYLRCVEPVLQLVAMLSYRDPFLLTVAESRADARAARLSLALGDYSEHLIYVRAYQELDRLRSQGAPPGHPKRDEVFMTDHFISPQNMNMARRIKSQLKRELERVGLVTRDNWPELNRNACSWPLVKACLVAGAHPRVGFLRNERRFTYIDTVCRDKVQISQNLRRLQPPTVMGEHKMNFIFFEELTESPSGETTARQCTLVDGMYAALFAGRPALPPNLGCEDRPKNALRSDSSMFILDDRLLAFACTKETCERLNWLRVRLLAGFMRYMSTKHHHGLDVDRVVEAVEAVLSNADVRGDVDLQQIVLRPPDGCPAVRTFWQRERDRRTSLCRHLESPPAAAEEEKRPTAAPQLPVESESDRDRVIQWLQRNRDQPEGESSQTGEAKAAEAAGVDIGDNQLSKKPSRLRHNAGAFKAVSSTRANTRKPLAAAPTKTLTQRAQQPAKSALVIGNEVVDVSKPPPPMRRANVAPPPPAPSYGDADSPIVHAFDVPPLRVRAGVGRGFRTTAPLQAAPCMNDGPPPPIKPTPCYRPAVCTTLRPPAPAPPTAFGCGRGVLAGGLGRGSVGALVASASSVGRGGARFRPPPPPDFGAPSAPLRPAPPPPPVFGASPSTSGTGPQPPVDVPPADGSPGNTSNERDRPMRTRLVFNSRYHRPA